MKARKKATAAASGNRVGKGSPKEKKWGARFAKGMSETLVEFNASIDVDQRLAQEDIAGSLAHGQMLAKIGVLSAEEIKTLVKALNQISQEIQNGTFVFR